MITGRTITRSIILPLFLVGALVLEPLTASAQTPNSSQILQNFNPNTTLNMGGGTFNGISFNGIGGAISACTNTGGTLAKWTNSVTGSISGLFNAKSKGVTNPNATSISSMNSSGVNPGNLSQSQIDQHIQSITGSGSPNGLLKSSGAAGAVAQSVPVNDVGVKQQLEQANNREDCLKGIRQALAKSLLQQLVQKTIGLVNTGNFGNPYYVQNIGSYFNSIANQETQKFLNRIPTSNPIFGDAIRSIATESAVGIQDGLISTVMDTPQARAYQSFQENFSNGGWEALLNPDNNPLDAVFNAADQLNKKIAFEQQDVQNQLQRNGGLLDMRRCVEWDNGNGANAASTNATTATAQGATGVSQTGGCLTWETVTPGSVISAQINAVTTSPIRQLEQTDRIDNMLGSFFDQVLNNLATLGLSKLHGIGPGSTTIGSTVSNVVVGSNGTPLTITDAQNALGYSIADGTYISAEFDVSRPQDIRSVLQVQYDYLNRAEDAHAAESRIIPVLGALDYCIPGPNPTWQDGLAANIQAYDNSLQVEMPDGPSKAQQTAQSIIGAIPTYGAIANGIINTVGNIFGVNDPHAIIGTGVSLYDKVTNSQVPIRDTKWEIKHHSPNLVFTELQNRIQDVMNVYKGAYTKDAITSAFLAVDPANADYVRGFIDTSFNETSKLGAYDQALSQIDDSYTTNIANAGDAIKELEAIQKEADSIVATAKARYIAQQKAAGTPVNQKCLDNAYKIDPTPITVAPRVETDTPSPYASQSAQGTAYFYTHL